MAEARGAGDALASLTAGGHDERAYLVALVGLPGLGPARLRVLLDEGRPSDAWDRVVSGTVIPDLASGLTPKIAESWGVVARRIDPPERLGALLEAGVRVLVKGDADYPEGLERIVDSPAVLFVAGPLPPTEAQVSVAVVGTRRCTRYGFETARMIGRELTAGGVRVVSGLALGIDAAAHLGSLDALHSAGPGHEMATPIGVVASGLDVVYPRRHRRLWEAVAATGALVTEAPLGVEPEKWRFPARNRIIVGLSTAVVVVESHESGGALITAELAVDHDVPVYVVPGPVHNKASVGTNRLLGDVGRPLLAVSELLADLGVSVGRPNNRAQRRLRLSGPARHVLATMGWSATSLDEVVARTGFEVDVAIDALDELVNAGIVGERSGWFEQIPTARRL